MWIEVHQSLPTHKKTRRLARKLGLKNPVYAVGHLISLWLWAIDNAPDGCLSGIDAEDIADSAGWTGEADKLIEAMLDAGFLDDDDGRLYIHDWDIYIGKLIDQIEARKASNRERQRRSRSKHNAFVTRDNGVMSHVTGCDGHCDNDEVSHVTECDSNATTVPNRNLTKHNPTQPDTTTLPNPSHAGLGERVTGEESNSPSGGDFAADIPTVSEVRAYAALAGLEVNAEAFVRANEANGWRDSHGDPVRNWKLWLQGTLIRRTQGDTAQSKSAAFEALYHKFKEEEQSDQS